MALLLDGLRCKRGSYTPEYQLTKLIFSFRDHPTPYHAHKVGFELSAAEATRISTLQTALDNNDYDFLEHVMVTHNPDITTWNLNFSVAYFFVWDPLVSIHTIDRHHRILERILHWRKYQIESANVPKYNRIYMACFGGFSVGYSLGMWLMGESIFKGAKTITKMVCLLSGVLVGGIWQLSNHRRFRSYAAFRQQYHHHS